MHIFIFSVQPEGVEVDESCFKTAVCNEIVSNKVGANKLARQAAQQWIRDRCYFHNFLLKFYKTR